MGTATLKIKLLHQLIAMRETVLHSVFLYLCKAYEALERYRCLDILAGYGEGPRTNRMIQTYWAQLQMAAKAEGHCGTVL